MKFSADETIDAEIFHYFDDKLRITSKCNKLKIEYREMSRTIDLPLSWIKQIFSTFRIVRRAIRTDKCVFHPIFANGKLVAVVGAYQGGIYKIDWPTMLTRKTGVFRQGRVPLHQSICLTETGNIFLGEYSSNSKNLQVQLWKSKDGGGSWEIVFEFARMKARHIHGCFWDTFEKKIWICTGDKDGECNIISADEEFKQINWFGDGTQIWRTCHLIFRKEYVIWGMDSPLIPCYINKLNRRTGELQQVQKVSGPIWYAKDLCDGWTLFASSVEGGVSEEDNYAKIYAAKDESNWQEIYRVEKDSWPMLFKYGVIAFASGNQDSSRFYIFGEALKELDGKALRCSIQQLGESTNESSN